MFRSKQYCERYEQTPIQLDTPLISALGNNVKQKKVVMTLQLMIEVHILIGLMVILK